MNPTRFDTISKLFASRKTRRSAIAGGASLAAASVASVGGRAFAQDATPVALPDEPHSSADEAKVSPDFLFVQPFDAGTWTPKDGEDDVYTLTLTGAAAHTVYFSDRPERIVGLAENQQFLDGLGFSPNNPPNAAIVAPREGEEGQEVLVIELLNPAYDADAESLTYDAIVLADYGEPGLAHLARQQQDYEIGETFGQGGLFIDDCTTRYFECLSGGAGTDPVGYIRYPLCWNADQQTCVPCSGKSNLNEICAEAWRVECSGGCAVQFCNPDAGPNQYQCNGPCKVPDGSTC